MQNKKIYFLLPAILLFITAYISFGIYAAGLEGYGVTGGESPVLLEDSSIYHRVLIARKVLIFLSAVQLIYYIALIFTHRISPRVSFWYIPASIITFVVYIFLIMRALNIFY